MKILIIGNGRHGKDTVAELLNESIGMTFTPSSLEAAAAILPALNASLSPQLNRLGDKYNTVDEAFKDRHNHRELWKELITLYNTPNKSALVEAILAKSDCYVGLRCIEEYNASKHLFDTILYVHAFARHPKEETFTIPFNPADMILVNNNGTLEDLKIEVQQLTEYHGIGI